MALPLPLASTLPTLLIALFWLGSCGGDEGLRFEGAVGSPQPLQMLGDAPLVDTTVTLADGLPRALPLLLDSGAPVTVLSSHALPGVASGWPVALVEALGLRFPELVVGVAPLFSASPCAPAPAGVLGADILRAFRTRLDYGRGELIFDGDPLVGDEELPLSLAGGGRLSLESGAKRSIGATRLLVEVSVEGRPVTALIDTGASVTVLSETLWKALGGSSRASTCCQSFNTQQGLEKAPLLRLRQLKLGALQLDDVPVTVLTDAAVFAPLSSEVGREVSLLLGGSVLRYLVTELDPIAGRLRLSLATSKAHIDEDEWLRPGFSFCRTTQRGALLLDVFVGSDAAKQGLRAGQRLLAVDGKEVTSLDARALANALRAPGVGGILRLRLEEGGQTLERDVKVEDVLPR